jgi:hypothetical protein
MTLCRESGEPDLNIIQNVNYASTNIIMLPDVNNRVREGGRLLSTQFPHKSKTVLQFVK